MGELKKFFPRLSESDITHWHVVKEGRATPLITPGTEAIRPDNITNLNGYYVAGDWTATELPATIESAALSGIRAAKNASDFLNQ
jgi:zeta-carotene desaturase